MGSSLIFLVIVGAWLAVLVPMVLRSQEGNALGSVDKFHDAMRVLSRQDRLPLVDGAADAGPAAPQASAGGRPAGTPPTGEATTGEATAEEATAEEATAGEATAATTTGTTTGTALVGTATAWLSSRRVSASAGRRSDDGAPGPGRSLVARRRRLLVALVVAALLLLLLGVIGPRWLLVAHGLVDLALLGYLGHLRGEAIRTSDRQWREALEARLLGAQAADTRTGVHPDRLPAETSVRVRYAPLTRVAGIPDRMPPRVPPMAEHAPPVEAEAAVPETPAGAVSADRPAPVVFAVPTPPPSEPAPARGAQGAPWAPVPVPKPLYISAAKAPRPRPAHATPDEQARDAPQESGAAEPSRRAVNDW